jgi:hypothetical protein
MSLESSNWRSVLIQALQHTCLIIYAPLFIQIVLIIYATKIENEKLHFSPSKSRQENAQCQSSVDGSLSRYRGSDIERN